MNDETYFRHHFKETNNNLMIMFGDQIPRNQIEEKKEKSRKRRN